MTERRPVILSERDKGRLDRFLMTRVESSLTLLSNARRAGLEDQRGIFQGTYAAYREGDAITGVAAHFWNGIVVLQVPENPSALFSAALAASGRPVSGIAGPYDQVREVLTGLPQNDFRPVLNGRETLFSLDISALIVPGALHRGDVTCRLPYDDEVPTLVDWRIAFMREHLGESLHASRKKEARELVTAHQESKSHWVLVRAETMVATAAASAGIPEMAQLGGIYTLPEYRNRGFGRAVVAGALLDLFARGTKKAILFTGNDKQAAQKVYRALGFRPIGEYGLVLFR